MKERLDAVSGISKFKHARVYRRACKDAYRYAKVTFACDLLYCISYYFHHRLHRKEAGTKTSFTTNQAHHRNLVSFAFAHTIYVDLTAHGLGHIYSHVIRTARSLYRCRLSCKHAFPSPDLMKEWAKDVWDEACARGGTHPYLLNKNEEAGLFFCLCGADSHGFSVRI
jgi:hypothetical protein